MNKRMQCWELAEELYFSLINKEPYEKLKSKIEAYLAVENNKLISEALKIIYCISMAVSDEKTFEMLSEYVKEYGIDYKFFDNSLGYYYLYKISLSDAQNIKSVFDYFDISISDSYFILPLAWIIAMEKFSGSEWRLHNDLGSNYGIRNNILIVDEYIYYLVSKKRLEKLKEFCDARNIGMTAALNIAIDYPDVFYGYIKDNFSDKLPKYFKYGNRVRTIEKLIPFLCSSKRFSKDFFLDTDICDIISYLYDTIGMQKLKKISIYIPEIKFITLDTIKYVLASSDELIEFIISKVGDHIILKYSEIFSYFTDYSCTIKFFDRLLHSKIQINAQLLKPLIRLNDDLLNYFLNKGAETPLSIEEKITLMKEFMPLDDEGRTQTMIRIGVISPETWNEAVAFAVENNAFKALNVLNLQYNDIMSG